MMETCVKVGHVPCAQRCKAGVHLIYLRGYLMCS